MSSSYVVLARKYRPQQFSDIVGQTPVVRTLMNALQASRIHHAYLFTGSRGIGKTSIARIFSKALRCSQTRWEAPWLISCGECSSCREIAAGSSVDVLEIDGASNNGVDAIREIRESAKFLPSFGNHKIYIIDEVHMLTTAAFNALLKTLEEPPAHVIFVLATTEPHKIPATILSRLQRFDFRRVTLAQIQERLIEILRQESIEAESGALALVARAADGSMRDALSLLDQVIAYSSEKVTLTSVRESIGLISGEALINTLRAVFERNASQSLEWVERIYRDGHDLKTFCKGLIDTLHACVLSKVGASSSTLLELSDEERAAVKELSTLRSLEEMELIFQALHQGMDWISRSPQPKIVLDVLLIKCALADALVEISSTTATPRASIQPPAPVAQRTAPIEKVAEKPPAQAPIQSRPVVTEKPAEKKTWEGFIQFVKQVRPLLASNLEHASEALLPESGKKELRLVFLPANSYKFEQLQSKFFKDQLQSLSDQYFGPGLFIQCSVREGAGESLAARKEREIVKREEDAKSAVLQHPLINEARALFGGELGPIQLTSPNSLGGPDASA